MKSFHCVVQNNDLHFIIRVLETLAVGKAKQFIFQPGKESEINLEKRGKAWGAEMAQNGGFYSLNPISYSLNSSLPEFSGKFNLPDVWYRPLILVQNTKTCLIYILGLESPSFLKDSITQQAACNPRRN